VKITLFALIYRSFVRLAPPSGRKNSNPVSLGQTDLRSRYARGRRVNKAETRDGETNQISVSGINNILEHHEI